MSDTDELFYPEILVFIGPYIFNRGITVELNSSQDSHFDFASIKFTKELDPEVTISELDRANIQIGYNGIFETVFSGFVAKPRLSSLEAQEIVLKDEMLLLQNLTITNTFMDTTPQEIIKYCLSKVGLTKLKINSRNFSKKTVNVSKKNGIEVIEQIKTIWNTNHKFFFSDGTFYFGESPDQENVYKFQYGLNIISLTKLSGLWRLETVSAPFVRHSHYIEVFHPSISGMFEVKKVVFKTNEAGFIRTVIDF